MAGIRPKRRPQETKDETRQGAAAPAASEPVDEAYPVKPKGSKGRRRRIQGDGASPRRPTRPRPDDTTSTDASDTDDAGNDASPDGQAMMRRPPPEPAFSYYTPGQSSAGIGNGAPERTGVMPPTWLSDPHGALISSVDGLEFRRRHRRAGTSAIHEIMPIPGATISARRAHLNRNTPFCPADRVHQGQDIRVGTPKECQILRNTPPDERVLHEVVAVEDGVVYDIATYTVKLRADGRIYRYMHLNMDALQVSEGDAVQAGDVLGYVSKDFGGTPTTFHLHFEIIQNTAEHGWVHVPPYLSLVEAYERREQAPGERLEAPVTTASAIPEIPEDFEIIE